MPKDRINFREVPAKVGDEQNRVLSRLNAVSHTINQSLDLEQTQKIALEKVIEVLNADATLIRLLDDETKELVVASHMGFSESELKRIVPRRKFGTGSCWQCVQSGKPAIIKRVRKGSSILHKNGYLSSYIIPLKSKDRIVGTMGVQQRTSRDFLPEDIDLFTIIGNQIT
jgi:GAF domain-containing protein